MVNIDNLNIAPLELNTSVITNGSIIENSVELLNNAFPYWLFSAMTALYIILVYYLFKQQELYRLDFNQSSMAASFIVAIVSYGAIIAGLSTSIVPLTFYGIIWIINVITQYYIKKRG